jgi:hypothetical protein
MTMRDADGDARSRMAPMPLPRRESVLHVVYLRADGVRAASGRCAAASGTDPRTGRDLTWYAYSNDARDPSQTASGPGLVNLVTSRAVVPDTPAVHGRLQRTQRLPAAERPALAA